MNLLLSLQLAKNHTFHVGDWKPETSPNMSLSCITFHVSSFISAPTPAVSWTTARRAVLSEHRWWRMDQMTNSKMIGQKSGNICFKGLSCFSRRATTNLFKWWFEHHPTIRYMVYNGYYKVMSNIPKMGQLPTPEAFQTKPSILFTASSKASNRPGD